MHTTYLVSVLAMAVAVAALPVRETRTVEKTEEAESALIFNYSPYKEKRDTDTKEDSLLLFDYNPYKKRDKNSE